MPDAFDAPVVLDTHVWLWVVEGTRDKLSPGVVQEIEAASKRGEVVVSAISVWEVAMLEAKGRITLSRPMDEWVRSALRAPGSILLGLTPGIAVECTRLPGSPHGDPADLILIASARAIGARLATCDRRIIDYADKGYLTVLDARA